MTDDEVVLIRGKMGLLKPKVSSDVVGRMVASVELDGGAWMPEGSLWRSHPYPAANPTGWIAGVSNSTAAYVLARAYAVCATVAP